MKLHSLQGHAGKNKTHSLMKRDFFNKGLHKDIENSFKIAIHADNTAFGNIHMFAFT